jgi:hypothetical protein
LEPSFKAIENSNRLNSKEYSEVKLYITMLLTYPEFSFLFNLLGGLLLLEPKITIIYNRFILLKMTDSTDFSTGRVISTLKFGYDVMILQNIMIMESKILKSANCELRIKG